MRLICDVSLHHATCPATTRKQSASYSMSTLRALLSSKANKNCSFSTQIRNPKRRSISLTLPGLAPTPGRIS
eukprot:7440010-Pyramimonas_sp.AAC.1